MRINNNHGAFLLEVLLAVFILSVALVGLIRGLLSSLNASVEAEKYSNAILVLDNALIEVIRLNGQKVVSPVDFKNAAENVKAEAVIKPPENVQIPTVLMETRLRASWPGKLKDKEIEAVTLIFGSGDENK